MDMRPPGMETPGGQNGIRDQASIRFPGPPDEGDAVLIGGHGRQRTAKALDRIPRWSLMRAHYTPMLVADLAGLQLLGLRFLEIDFHPPKRMIVTGSSRKYGIRRIPHRAPRARSGSFFFHIPAYDMQMCQRIHGFSLVLGEGDGFPAGKGGKAEFHPMKFRGVACC